MEDARPRTAEVFVKVGSEAQIVCGVGLPTLDHEVFPLSVEWLFIPPTGEDPIPVELTLANYTVEDVGLLGNGVLNIGSLREEDLGTYACAGTSLFGQYVLHDTRVRQQGTYSVISRVSCPWLTPN